MTHFDRLRMAFVVSVILVGIMMVIDIIFSLDIGEVIFSLALFFVPTFVVSYLFAPLIGKYIKYK